ncbi:hypothetical protein WKH08_09720 [Pantoea agglomerans]|uniref:hypothetical protein n=1 Tax=Enterobacter agglomerans TaxID=549 RepID=UPI003C7C6DF7
MTVSTVVNHEQYDGNGITTVFPYRFRILTSSHMVVTTSDPDGNISVLVEGTGYTVTGVGLVNGGNVELKAPLKEGWGISLDRELPAVQETDLRNQGRFYAETHENAFDYLTMLIQQVEHQVDFLALKKPSALVEFYDALQQRISYLAPPVNGGDAVNKNYADALQAGSKSYVDALIRIEAEQRIAADIAESRARADGDANLQSQLTGKVPLEASAFSPISWHAQRISNSVSIPPNMNAWSFGPAMTIQPGQQVTVGDNSYWTIANGEVNE